MSPPPSEAGLILAHYIKQLVLQSGLRWTEANAADMRRLSTLLAAPDEPQDAIPPYRAAEERTTVVLDREPAGAEADPGYREWRWQQYDGDADAAVSRMVRRNGGGR